MPLGRLGAVLEAARGLGLVRRDEAAVANFLRPQPALAWFLTSRLAAAGQAERKVAVECAFRRLYNSYARALFQLQQAKEPEERKLAYPLVEQEYANLGAVLRLALEQDESILEPYQALSEHLDVLRDHRRGLELGETVLRALERRPPETMKGQRGVELVEVVSDIAGRQRTVKRFEEAKASYGKALALLAGLEGWDEKQAARGHAIILHRLGMVAEDQHRLAEAEDRYKQALGIHLAFDDRHNAAATYLHLGGVALEQRQFTEAEDYYQKALGIHLAFDSRHNAAATYHGLGRTAEEQRRFTEAEGHYRQALEIYAALDRHNAAIVLRSLARLWRASSTDAVPRIVAEVLGSTPAEAEMLLEEMLDGSAPS